MVALVELDEEESYLLAILDSPNGIDLAEFAVHDARNPDGCYRLFDYQWCFAGDTVVLTKDGYLPIGKLVGPITLMTEKQGKPAWVDAEVRSFGTQRIWELTLEQYGVRKTIRTTGNHRWFAGRHKAPRRYEQVQTMDLGPGQFLQTITPRRLTGVRVSAYGVAHGMVWGDGTVSGSGSCNLVLWGEKRELTRFIPEEGYPVDDSDVSVPGLRHTMLPSSFKEPVRLTESASYLYGWLAGYFAADGSVSAADGQCVLVSASKESIDLVRDVCLRLGIRTGAGNGRDGHGGFGAGGSAYSLVLYSQDLSQEFFLREFHREKWRRFSNRKRYANRDWKVLSVTETDDWEEVYCAVVPETHKFVLDGYLLTGNCWFSSDDTYQIDQGARNLGKTERIKLRSIAFPFYHPGKNMLLTAPELNHLRPLTDEVEKMLLNTRLVREMLPTGKGAGIARQPHWQCRFKNGAMIFSRLPNKDGKGVKGMHVVDLEIDEAQDYPGPGWKEVVETLNAGDPDAIWCCHGVSRGVRDSFFEKTQPGSGWKTHRPMAMNRPSWTKEERDNKITEYGGSRQAVDYRRNIYGEHGDAANSVFVLAKLMAVVDLDEGSVYNADVYTAIKIEYERFPDGASDDERAALLMGWLDVPGEHFNGYSQKIGNKEVGSPKGYTAYWAGMDVGVTNHPSEILIFGQRTGTDFLELALRVQMHRVNTDDQLLVVERLFEIYGEKLRLGIDKTGVGFPLWDQLTRRACGARVYGFGFSEKRVVAIEDRPLEAGETIEDLAKMRNVVEASTDWLRNDYVDAKRIRLPYDREVLVEFQGQTYSVVRDSGDPYGMRRQFAGGSFHTLDAAKIAVATKHIPPLEDLLKAKPAQNAVLDVFMGA